MAEVFFENPPALQGKEENQLRQLYGYLNSMSEKLNMALMDVSLQQLAPETREKITQTESATKENYTSLKSMIVKTAEIVRHEMDEIRVRLEDSYTALSEQFGEYERNLTSEITETAEGILQEYNFQERVTELEADTASFEQNIRQYIYTGLISSSPVRYGLAIGENVTNADGSLNGAAKCATFTMEELAFYKGETKLAWFSNNMMHIANSEVTETMKMGNHIWKIMPDNAMALISG